MSRTIRKYSNSGYMHVMIRGLTRQIIFNDDFDMKKILALLIRFSNEYSIKVVCYCLMINHAHFLFYDEKQNISDFMKAFCGTYTQYFNKKYDRCGTLFQRPFKSKPIENDKYILSAYHYIMNNTAKDGICLPHHYAWNSYKYAGKNTEVFDDSVVMDMIGGRNNLDLFLNDENIEDYSFGENSDFVKVTDLGVVQEIQEHYKIKTTTSIRFFSKEKRDEAVRWLKYRGLSVRQIERLTGIGRGEVQAVR